jgi:gliding motility-associated-like protein/uncharacterized repeat protein (TIGR01451 family)
MNVLYKLMVICGLLLLTRAAYSQNTGSVPTGGLQNTFVINAGAGIVLHGNAVNAAAYQWFKNGVPISGALSKNYTATSAGIYSVIAYNLDGCPSLQSDSVTVTVNDPAIPQGTADTTDLMVSISTDNDNVMLGQENNYTITASNNSKPASTGAQVTYIIPSNLTYMPALPASGAISLAKAPTISYVDSTRTLIWNINKLTENNPSELTVSLKAEQSGPAISKVSITGIQFDPNLANNVYTLVQQINTLKIANVFTPNGDGINDTFMIPGLNTYTENEIYIMNRWGSEVYTKKNYDGTWTGQGLAEGTYFYILKAKALSGAWEVYKGYITLLRSKM